MKTRHLFGLLVLTLCTLAACSLINTDEEERIIIMTDKGLNIDDDKTHQRPDSSTPTTPGSGQGSEQGQQGERPDTIINPNDKGEIEPPVQAMNTLYVTDNLRLENDSTAIEQHIVVRKGGRLIIANDNCIMYNDATITIENHGTMIVDGVIRQADLTIKSGGILDIYDDGAIFLRSKESLHLELNAIIYCNSSGMTNEGLHIFAPPTDPLASNLVKIDSLEIEDLRRLRH